MPKRIVLLCVLLLLATGPVLARSPVQVKTAGGAKITAITGEAVLERQGAAPAKLTAGQTLLAEDLVKTGPGCRLEIVLEDKSIVRFDEKTSFQLKAVQADPAKERNVSIKMFLGRVWGKVAKKLGPRGRFNFTSPTCIAGVRGTVYRMNVHADSTSVVKVYSGEVEVQGAKKAPAAGAASGPAPLGKPASVSGPTPVEGPKPVTMEEWVYIVKSMQQITVRPDGTATTPYSFDPRKDANDWVRWNQQRDSQL